MKIQDFKLNDHRFIVIMTKIGKNMGFIIINKISKVGFQDLLKIVFVHVFSAKHVFFVKPVPQIRLQVRFSQFLRFILEGQSLNILNFLIK